jgi:glycosyltransferase involved in cell wall biosynthesis
MSAGINASGRICGKPKVVIGVPVFNEATYLKQSLDSLIGLSYKNLEIVVSDNGSTDGTSALIHEFASKDHRIKYIRHDCNIGAQANFQYCLDNSDGDYFMWGSGHDLWGSELVKNCVEYLESDPDCVLAYGSTVCIDGNGSPSREREFPSYDTIGLHKALARMHFVLWGSMNPILGVFRASALSDTKLVNVVGSDLIFLLEMSLKGTFKLIATDTFYRREVRQLETHDERMKRYTGSNFSIYKGPVSRALPMISLAWTILRMIAASKLPLLEKSLALVSFFFIFPAKLLVGKNNRKP